MRNSYVNELKKLIQECGNHLSIDTYARILYLKNDLGQLEITKFIFNEFLIYEQIINGVDKRYDGFFAALIKKNHLRAGSLGPNSTAQSVEKQRDSDHAGNHFKGSPRAQCRQSESQARTL